MGCEVKDNRQDRTKEIKGVRSSLDVLNGKWKMAILSSIYYHDERRFSDILKDVEGISNKMLSKELKDLEFNNLVKRTIFGKHPWYELTEQGRSLKTIIDRMTEWGIARQDKMSS